MNQGPGSHHSTRIEASNIRPSSQSQHPGEQPLPNQSRTTSHAEESGDILTRTIPENRVIPPNGQPINVRPGQPTIIQPNSTGQTPYPQIPQGNVQMTQQNMIGPGGQGYPRQPGAQPQLPPGYPQNYGQPGYPPMGQPQLPPGSRLGPPQFTPMPPQQNRPQNISRFEGDMKGVQDSNNSDSTYANTQICCKKYSAWMAVWLPCCCIGTNPYRIVPEGFSGTIKRFGKFYKLVGPGMHYVLDEIDVLELVDKREKVVELKQQSVVSRDNTSFRVDAVLYYRAMNTYKSKFAVSNVALALQDLASTTLRNVVGRMTMQQFLEAKEHLAEQIEQEIVHSTEKWGTKVIRVLVQDVYLPQEFRNSFSSSAVAKRISEAQIINSKAEVEVARLMRDAADALSTDAAFQIRYIDAIEVLSKSSNPKMIFFPADYTDVGTANNDLLSTMTDEMETLLRKR